MKSQPFLLLLLGAVLVSSSPLYAQFQVTARYDGKQLGLTPVWTRIADIYGEAGSVESVEFSPDGHRLVSGTKFDNTVIMWRTSDGTELWRQTVPQEIERVAWSPDGQFVASCSEDFFVRIFDAADGRLIQELEHDNGIDGLAWSHNGRWLASGEEQVQQADGSTRGLLRLFEMPGSTLAKTADLGATINTIDFSSDDTYILAAGQDGLLKVWRTEDMSLVLDVDEDMSVTDGNSRFHFISARFHPDDDKIIVGDTEGNVHVMTFPGGEVLRRFDRSGHKVEIVEWTPDGQYIVTAGNDPFIRFFRTADVLSDQRLYTALQVHAGDQAEYLHFNQLGSLMASAHQDGAIRLWIVMSEDPTVNTRRHEMVKAQQREAARTRANQQNDSNQ